MNDACTKDIAHRSLRRASTHQQYEPKLLSGTVLEECEISFANNENNAMRPGLLTIKVVKEWFSAVFISLHSHGNMQRA